MFTGGAAVALAETIEDKGQEFRIDSSTGVGDNKFGVRIVSLQADLNAPAVGSEFDRVREQVPEHLLQAVRITGNRTYPGVEHELDSNALGVRRQAHDIYGRLNNRRQVDRAGIQAELARNNA